MERVKQHSKEIKKEEMNIIAIVEFLKTHAEVLKSLKKSKMKSKV